MAIEPDARPKAFTSKRASTDVIWISKEEEGSSKGELWAVLRALAILIGLIVLIVYIIG